jgi:ribosomal protein S18 acetylase RimI-like enzyme
MAEYDSGDGRWSVKPTSLPTLNFHQFEPHVRFSAGNPYSNYGSKIHRVDLESHDPDKANPDYEKMGFLEWHKDTGEILSLKTHPKFRRMGVANTLFHEAKEAARKQGLVEPVHSADRSDEGDEWAKQAGGNVPPRGKYTG